MLLRPHDKNLQASLAIYSIKVTFAQVVNDKALQRCNPKDTRPAVVSMTGHTLRRWPVLFCLYPIPSIINPIYISSQPYQYNQY
jgi:hypothetical protein